MIPSIKTLVRLILAAAALAACSQQAEEIAPVGPQPVRIAGSSTVLPLTNAIAAAYRATPEGADVVITAAETGTVAGLTSFCEGELDIAGASRPILAREMIACFRNNVRYIEVPIAFDGITVIVHPTNPLNSITVDQLAAIWHPDAQGAVTTWRHADGRWRDTLLTLFGPGRDSGTFEYFSSAVVGEAGGSRSDYTASEHDDDIINGVAADPNALGYVGLAHFERNRERLKALAVDNGAGPVEPSQETVRGGRYQPLSRPIFIYVAVSSLDRPEVAQFAEYYVTHAGGHAASIGYVALPDEAYASYLDRVSSRRVGSAFSGSEATGETIEQMLARPLVEASS